MKKNANTMSNAEFKKKAKTHQTNFRNDPEIGVVSEKKSLNKCMQIERLVISS